MDTLTIFFLVMIGIGIVVNIIGWTDYYKNRSQRSSHRETEQDITHEWHDEMMNGLTLTLLGLLAFAVVMHVIAWVDYQRRSRGTHSRQ
jgi:cytochrome b